MQFPLLVSGLVFFFTHSLVAITGFGSAIMAMPFIIAMLGMRQGVIMITILAWVLALYIAISKKQDINFRQFSIIIGLMIPGLPLGMFFFRTFDVLQLKSILAIFIMVISTWQLFRRLVLKKTNTQIPSGLGIFPYYLALLAGGVVQGMLSIGGPLVVLYASRVMPDKGQFRATLCLLWSILNTVLIAVFFIEGSISSEIAVNTGIMLPFVIAGMVVGEKIHNKLDERFFSVIVFSMLLLTGLFMVFF